MKEQSNQQEATKGKKTPKKKKKELKSWERVQLLQQKLYLKAKEEKGYKFYVLYDKVFIGYVLEESWRRVRKNNGKPGVDGVTFEQIEKRGVRKFLEELKEALRKQTYKAQSVRRVEIEKQGGGVRPLGIPTIRDRVAQMACKLIIEPLFEADFTKDSYGFRPERSAHGAISEIKGELKRGKTEVYDADLSKYFDRIPHDRLEIALRERISDKRIIDLIKKWLRAPVREEGQDKGGKKRKVGTPQGGVISPLLSNIYLNLLDQIIANPKSIFGKSSVRIIRYADDFVLLGSELSNEVKERLKELLSRMGLTLNAKKSKQVNAKAERFDFLGFTFSYDKSLYGPKTKKYWNVQPSQKSQNKLREKLKEKLRKIGHFPPEMVALELNSILRGWFNYYSIAGVSYPKVAQREIRYYLKDRLLRYYNRKSQRKSRLYRQQAFEKLVTKYGLIDPTKAWRKTKL